MATSQITRMVILVDDAVTPRFPAEVIRSCEEAVEYLSQCPQIDELWLNHDLHDHAEIETFIEWLIEQTQWESRVEIGVIKLFSEVPDGCEHEDHVLAPYYRIEHVEMSADLFEIEP